MTNLKRPLIFTNFVSTVDGKVQVLEDTSKYWPIGSEKDFDHLLDLRARSDLLVHGRATALGFRHVDRISSDQFKKKRLKYKKSPILPYMVVSSAADDSLIPFLTNPSQQKAILATTYAGNVSETLAKDVDVLRLGEKQVDIKRLVKYFSSNGYEKVLVEGGPKLVGSFLNEGFLDEIYLTIAPKIFGNLPGKTLSLIEGLLFPPEKIKKLKLLSVKKVNDELFLHYSII